MYSNAILSASSGGKDIGMMLSENSWPDIRKCVELIRGYRKVRFDGLEF